LQALFGSNKTRTALTFASTMLSTAGALANAKATADYGASTSVAQDRSAGLWAGVGGTITNAISGAI